MKRFGFDILKNHKSWLAWLRENRLLPPKGSHSKYGPGPEPEEYPCIAEIRVSSCEEEYPEYIYMETVEKMKKALIF